MEKVDIKRPSMYESFAPPLKVLRKLQKRNITKKSKKRKKKVHFINKLSSSNPLTIHRLGLNFKILTLKLKYFIAECVVSAKALNGVRDLMAKFRSLIYLSLDLSLKILIELKN